jgi:hypothetical protein
MPFTTAFSVFTDSQEITSPFWAAGSALEQLDKTSAATIKNIFFIGNPHHF